jgi:hypothetical protein
MPIPLTSIRANQRRTRSLSIDEQLRECVDQLQHPELIGAEFRDSFAQVQQYLGGADPIVADAPKTQETDTGAEGQATFYPSREIFVVRDSSSFTCLATAVGAPLGTPAVPEEQDAQDEGYDYLALTCTSTPRPVLGVVQSERDQSAYPLLLRQLANLCELAHPKTLDHYDRLHFKGLLGNVPLVDLHLVLWEDWNEAESRQERTPISQLTRDLAEHVKTRLSSEKRIPPILGDIVCLQMNKDRFDGRVRFDWRV